MVEVGVRNPVPGLTTVAVAPFFNLSAERTVDGRRFAMAYYAELQKTPGFQVVPVGVVEQALFDNRLNLSTPADALKLAELLGVDAVVIGAVTDYSPYYPPRLGMQVSWYSPQDWIFSPGIPVDELESASLRSMWRQSGRSAKRGWTRRSRGDVPCQTVPCETAPCPAEPCLPGSAALTERPVVLRAQSPSIPAATNPLEVTEGSPLPLMSYTRLFDGADPNLTARLRDYVELSGDLRSGGWEAYLHRSEDFIRFTSHVMIVEMLQLHGGESRHRIVIKPRKYQ